MSENLFINFKLANLEIRNLSSIVGKIQFLKNKSFNINFRILVKKIINHFKKNNK
tara:strand:+ start:23504 stop:23668 length:165 start_codon:yes stop_codon:yes gene_type:complete